MKREQPTVRFADLKFFILRANHSPAVTLSPMLVLFLWTASATRGERVRGSRIAEAAGLQIRKNLTMIDTTPYRKKYTRLHLSCWRCAPGEGMTRWRFEGLDAPTSSFSSPWQERQQENTQESTRIDGQWITNVTDDVARERLMFLISEDDHI